MDVRGDIPSDEGGPRLGSGTPSVSSGTRSTPSRKAAGTGIGGRDLSRLIEALPPHAPGAEMSLLGAMLWDHSVIPEVIGIVSSGDDFYKSSHQVLFQTMIELYDKVKRQQVRMGQSGGDAAGCPRASTRCLTWCTEQSRRAAGPSARVRLRPLASACSRPLARVLLCCAVLSEGAASGARPALTA